MVKAWPVAGYCLLTPELGDSDVLPCAGEGILVLEVYSCQGSECIALNSIPPFTNLSLLIITLGLQLMVGSLLKCKIPELGIVLS